MSSGNPCIVLLSIGKSKSVIVPVVDQPAVLPQESTQDYLSLQGIALFTGESQQQFPQIHSQSFQSIPMYRFFLFLSIWRLRNRKFRSTESRRQLASHRRARKITRVNNPQNLLITLSLSGYKQDKDNQDHNQSIFIDTFFHFFDKKKLVWQYQDCSQQRVWRGSQQWRTQLPYREILRLTL